MTSPTAVNPSKNIGGHTFSLVWHLSLIGILGLTFFPFVFMLITSLKDLNQFYHTFWMPAFPLCIENYSYAWKEMDAYIFNSVVITGISIVGIVVFSCISGFLFARYEFPGREVLYYGTIAMMMVPGVLMLVPAFQWAHDIDKWLKGFDTWLHDKEILADSVQAQLHFLDTYLVMILPYIAGGQVLGVYLLRSFFGQIDKELFEAAEVDGAGALSQLWHIGIPMARPIIGVVVIISALGVWNQFLWPLVTTSGEDVMVVTVGMLRYTTRAGGRYGEMFAGYTVSAIPLGILFLFCTRLFMKGITSGALKA